MLFSVIVPVYNRERLVVHAIESILQQDYQYFEIVVIDDGSQDNTRNVLNEFSKKDNRIQCIFQRNKGASAARNAGVSAAKGDVIVYLDSDDTVKPTFLSAIKISLETASEKTFGIVNQVRHVVLVDKELNILDQLEPEVLCERPPTLQEYYHWKVKTTSSGLFHLREVFLKKGHWNEDLRYIEDWDFLMQLGNLDPKGFTFVMDPLVFYTQRYGTEEGMCSRAKYADWAKAFDEIYHRHKDDKLMNGQEWWPNRVEKYKKLQKLVEQGKEKPAMYKYFPDYQL